MKHSLFIYTIIICLTTSFLASADSENNIEPNPSTSIVIGQEVTLYSSVLSEERKLLIHVPDSYSSQPNKRYPVIYTLDGQTHFRHITGTMNWLSQQTIRVPEMIVVAITNTNRGRDMSATYNGGGSDKFIQFLNNELIPFIQKEYRTQPFRILSGHSMAGHLTLNVMNQSPDSFNAYIAMSPWFRQDDDIKMSDLIKEKLSLPTYSNKFLYLSIGDEPGLENQYNQFSSMLEQRAPSPMRWHSQPSKADNHMSIPTATINNALQFIFAPQNLEPDSDIAQAGVKSIQQYYEQLSTETYGYELSPEVAITRYGFSAMTNNELDKAITILKANTDIFPNSSEAFDALANVYHRAKQLKLALIAINKAIAIGKENNPRGLRWYERRKNRIENALKSKPTEG